MIAQPLEATVRRSGSTAVIDLHGEIDAGAEQALESAYAAAAATGPQALALNFSNVNYINSTGIALVVGILAQARKAKLPVSTFGLSEHYREIFEITRLSDFMTICADEAGALRSATGGGQARA